MKSRLRLHASGTVHRFVPSRAMPAVVGAQLAVARRRPSRMAEARQEMAFLLEHSDGRHDLDATAVRYLRWEIWRRESRWHPAMFPPLRVRGLEHLVRAHAQAGGVLVAGSHLGPYESANKSIVAAGGPKPDVLIHPKYFVERPLPSDVAFARMIGASAHTHPASIGVRGIVELLRTGRIVSMTTDMWGSTPLRFVGRDVLGASGASVAATEAGVPVVPRVLEHDDDGWFVHLLEPLDPTAFDQHADLLQALTTIQEQRVLARPEALVSPRNRYRPVTA